MALVTTTEMFKKSMEEHFAIGAFNVNNMEIIQGIVDAAAEENSPVIIQITENVIKYLVSNQLLYRSYKIRTIKSPLSSCRELDSFKLYYPDGGILSGKYHLTKKQLQEKTDLKYALFENHIAHTLFEAGYSLYYYQSEGKAEVNFIIQNRMVVQTVKHRFTEGNHSMDLVVKGGVIQGWANGLM